MTLKASCPTCSNCWLWGTLSPFLHLFSSSSRRRMGMLLSWGFFLKGNTVLTIARVCAFP